jgi:hypothetical protein
LWLYLPSGNNQPNSLWEKLHIRWRIDYLRNFQNPCYCS